MVGWTSSPRYKNRLIQLHTCCQYFGTMQRGAPTVQLAPNYSKPPSKPFEDAVNMNKRQKISSASPVKTPAEFDMLAGMLPLPEGGAEVQLKRAAELQAENEAVGQELQRQLEAAGIEAVARTIQSGSGELLEPEDTQLTALNAKRLIKTSLVSLVLALYMNNSLRRWLRWGFIL